MRRFLNILKSENGSINVIVALSITTIMAFSALVIDMGVAYISTSKAQNAADAVALSIGHSLPVKANDNNAILAIKQEGISYAAKNGFSAIPAESIQLNDLQNGYYYSVKVDIQATEKTNIASTIGIKEIKVSRSAKVKAMPASAISGAVPVGVDLQALQTAFNTGNYNHITLKYGGGDGTQGYYGFIVLDGSNGNANVLEMWLKYGYQGITSVGDTFPTATGNKASAAKEGFEYRYSRCTHYNGLGGCTAQRYVEGCPRIIKALVYQIQGEYAKIIGFAPFILEDVSDDDEIVGSYIKMSVNNINKTPGTVDCGSYISKLVE